MGSKSESDAMILAGPWCGLLAIACYASFFSPLPVRLLQYPAFAFGPLLIVGMLGLSEELSSHHGWIPTLRVGKLFGVIAGVLVNAVLVIQLANNRWHQERIAEASTVAEQEVARSVHVAVNRVQASLDVSWDLFLTVATIALAWTMISHPKFGKVIGVTGMAAGLLLLVLNLLTFPDGPAYAGLFDAGPILGLWFAIVFSVQLLRQAESSQSAS